jgi:uncharacterized protein YndB with AHSA1/START domain
MGSEIGRFAVRRSTFIKAMPSRVWQEFATLDSFRAWFGTGHTLEKFEPRPGGEVRLCVTVDGERRGFGGRIVAFEEGREITFEDNWDAPHAWSLPTFITIRLSSLYDGTHVELFHHGFERLGAKAGELLEGYEAGWDAHHLEALRAAIEA